VLLLLAAVVGLLVSVACWCFLELVHEVQDEVYDDLPGRLGFETMPSWWPLPWLVLAGLLTAIAIERLPGRGGHVPAHGLKTGGELVRPEELPGILLAAAATLMLGLGLGPEAPLIALGVGLGVLSLRRLRSDAPQQALALMGAAGSFAAVSTIFGSPVIGAVLIIEATGIGGALLPVVLLPGLIAAGIGSLVFIGLGAWTGFSTSAWELSPFPLPHYGGPDVGDFAWTILLAVAVAAGAFVVLELARWSERIVQRRRVALTAIAGLAVGLLAIAFAESTDEPVTTVLFSGEDAFGYLFAPSAALPLSTLALLLLCKGAAWSISLGAFRGGPTFPAIFLGAVAGLMAAELPGYAVTPAVPALIGATCVAVLRLPLSSIMIALLLCLSAGGAVAPLVIVAVVVAYLTSEALTAYVDARVGRTEAPLDA
jgi:H+/Cl- antiporter ClcA